MKEYNLNLFSIGHSNLSPDNFLKLLRGHDVQCLVDIRSSPYSKFNSQFNKESLFAFLQLNQIEYIWKGDSLGGKRQELNSNFGFRQDNLYDNDNVYKKGVLELMRIALKKRTAMMCSEEDPRNCHRHKIISNTIVHKKFEECNLLHEIHIYHIRASGNIEEASQIPVAFQFSLF
jgi:uncharacterized protein (DUF488 family)